MSHINLGFTSSTDALDKRLSTTTKPDPNRCYSEDSQPNVYVLELEDKKRSIHEDDDDYEPYNNREVEHPTTNAETLLHLLKGSLGTGILAMPKAFYHAGYALGFVATVIIGLICTYCMRMLVTSEYELCKRKKVPSLSYPATAEASLQEGPQFLRRFSRSSVHICNTFLMIYQLGACCVYVVFIATNIQEALKSYVPVIDVRYYMVALLLPLIFVNWIRNLKYLAPLSTVANVITLISFGIILYYIFLVTPEFEGRQPVGDVHDFPLYFGTVLFALEAIGVIMPLENEMKSPKNFIRPCGVLNIGMGTIVVLYAGIGFFGYIRYGNTVHDTITVNLPSEDILSKVVQILLAIAIFFTHTIQCYVAIDISWNDYISRALEKNSYKLFWEYVVRTVIVIITTLLAIAIPELDLFISLFGAFCLSALGMAFPALIQLCTFWKTMSPTEKKIMLVKNSCIILFGLVGLVVGTSTSLMKIIDTFK